MDRSQKEQQVATIRERFDKMSSAVLVDYKGLDVEAVTRLRENFRSAGVEYKVCKNTLVKNAIKGSDFADVLTPALTGMTGIAWSYEDPSAAAKVVKAFMKDAPKLTIKGALLDGQLLSASAVENTLATMPGKDELRAMLLATLQAPLQQFVQQLNAPLQNFVYVLAAKEEALKDG